MPRLPWKAIGAGGLAIGIIAAVVRAVHSPKVAPKRVALIGDSYAVGLGPELAKLLPTFRYAGVVGTNTSEWAHHAAACGPCGDWLTTFKPDVTLVSLGVNDGSMPNSANYQAIVQRLHGIGSRVMWIEPPADVQGADAARRIIRSLGAQTVPATTVPLSADGLHPTSYSQWAREVAQAVTGG